VKEKHQPRRISFIEHQQRRKMINKYILPFVFIVSVCCRAQTGSQEIINAKWFYYAYASQLNGYSSTGNEIRSLACDIKVNSIERINGDTTKFYFSLYQKDTLNICYLKPLELVGIKMVRNELYSPIYHSVIYEKQTDSMILKEMNKQNLLLQKSLESSKEVSHWLQAEFDRRKSK
jgi:hypothetical protein